MPLILVVDDHPVIAVAVRAVLRCAGLDSAVAQSGLEALEFLRHHVVDFVVLDVVLPGMSGLEVLRALRSGGEHANPPPVAMFSVDEMTRDESMRLGAVGFVCKADSATLLPLIQRHVRPLDAATVQSPADINLKLSA